MFCSEWISMELYVFRIATHTIDGTKWQWNEMEYHHYITIIQMNLIFIYRTVYWIFRKMMKCGFNSRLMKRWWLMVLMMVFLFWKWILLYIFFLVGLKELTPSLLIGITKTFTMFKQTIWNRFVCLWNKKSFDFAHFICLLSNVSIRSPHFFVCFFFTSSSSCVWHLNKSNEWAWAVLRSSFEACSLIGFFFSFILFWKNEWGVRKRVSKTA